MVNRSLSPRRTVRPFLPLLGEVIRFDAAPDRQRVLAALRDLPRLWSGDRNKVARSEIDETLLSGSWRRLVLQAPEVEPGCVDWRAWTLCVLEQFHRCLRRRDIFAVNSRGDPRAKLLAGKAWTTAKPVVLASLGLPPDPDDHLDERAELLHATFQEVADRVPANTAVRFDDAGRLHLSALPAEAEPPSLENLRVLTNRMLPRVDLPEVLLKVFSWTSAAEAFTSITGGEARLADLHITVAALLVAESCNIGWTPVIKHGAPALTRDRLAHVDATYLRMDTLKAANAALIDEQARIGLAQIWGGGHVASIDGMRFVVPVQTINARHNPHYWGQRRGATWLNMINNQAAGLAAKVVAGTPRDSLYVLDVLYDRDGGTRPQMIVTDTASYSDIVFGLLTLAGFTYAPQLADLPDQKLWRIDTRADYGPFTTAARGRIDLERVRRHWEDILRVTASIHTGAVRAHDVIRMLSRDGHPTPLADGSREVKVKRSSMAVVPIDTRLDADRRRAEVLRALGQDHERFVEYGLNLRDYGINTLIKQWRAGELLAIINQKTRIKLPPPPVSWPDDDVNSLIVEAVIRSVEPFMQSAILQGGWKPEGGASIKTYFIGRCYFAFATDYRREYDAEMKASKTLRRKKPDLELDVVRYVHHTIGHDPEQTVINRAEIRRLLALATHARIPDIVFLLADGMTSNEVGAALGMTGNAVDQALKKFRVDVSRAHGRNR